MGYTCLVLFKSFRHAGLRRLVLADDASGLPPAVAGKLRTMLSFLQAATNLQAVRSVPTWKVHQLSGNRKGTWALHVTKNWRLTFRVDAANQLIEVDYEDYH